MNVFIKNYLNNKSSILPSSVTKEDIIDYLYNSPDTRFLQKYNFDFTQATKKQLICILDALRNKNPLKCMIDITRPCGDNLTKFSKLPQYSLKQLEGLWQSQCKNLEQFKHQRPKTVKDYCSLLRNRYDKYLLSPVDDVPPAIKKIIAKVSKDTSLPGVYPATISIKLLYLVRYDNSELFRLLYNNGFEIFKQNFSLDKFKQKISINKNLHNFTPECFAWLQTQNDFLLNLPWNDKIRIVSYTYGGDKICNSYMLRSLNAKTIMDKFDRYERQRIFPLAYEIYTDLLTYASYADWMDSLIYGIYTNQLLSKIFEFTFDALKSVESYNFRAYTMIYKFMEQNANMIKPQAWNKWVESLIQGITQIINKAPSTPKDSFYVYRGVKEKSFVKYDSKNVFTNNLFMSTSLSIDMAYQFSNRYSCCIFEMQVLQNTKCLFISPLSYFTEELEILFAPGRHLLKIGKDHLDSDNKMSITNFTILN
jgi:hypothetical protein